MSSYIQIDSKDRLNPNSSSANFQVLFDDIFENSDKIISIESVILPISFYSVNDTNNTVNILGISGAGIAELANGTYNSSTFCTALDTAINAEVLNTGITVASSISATTGKLTIIPSAGDISITSDAYNYRYLGMNASSTVSSTSSVWISPSICDLTVSRYIDIICELPLASVNTTNKNRNVLARIPCNQSPFTTIYYSQSNFNFVSLLTRKFTQMTITLVDENQQVIDLNNLDWSLVLNVKTITPNSLN